MSNINSIIKALKAAVKSGDVMYRFEQRPETLLNKARFFDIKSIEEPVGMYFARDIRALPDLIRPRSTDEFGLREMIKGLRYGKFGDASVLVKAAPLYPEKILNLSNPRDYLDFLRGNAYDYVIERRLDKELAREYGRRLPQKQGDYWEFGRNVDPRLSINKTFAKFPLYISQKLASEGKHGIEFPDVAAGQPELTQIAMIKPGVTAIKYKGATGLLSLLGLLKAVAGDAE